jgi:hypothetical protein
MNVFLEMIHEFGRLARAVQGAEREDFQAGARSLSSVGKIVFGKLHT